MGVLISLISSVIIPHSTSEIAQAQIVFWDYAFLTTPNAMRVVDQVLDLIVFYQLQQNGNFERFNLLPKKNISLDIKK